MASAELSFPKHSHVQPPAPPESPGAPSTRGWSPWQVGRGWQGVGCCQRSSAHPRTQSCSLPHRQHPLASQIPFPLSGCCSFCTGAAGEQWELGDRENSCRQDHVALPQSCESLSQAQLKSAEHRGRIQTPNSKGSHSSYPSVWSTATSPWSGQHSCDTTGGDKGVLSPLSPHPGPSEGRSLPRSRIWGGRRVPVPGMLILLLPTAVEPLARGGSRRGDRCGGSQLGEK